MDSILERIYDGEAPYETIIVDSPEYQEKLTAFIDRSKQFQKTLRSISGELEETYIELQREQEIVDSYEVREGFVRGMSMGAAMILEILDKVYR